ncbi:MAG: phage tail protein [Nitrosospira sp.]|nr:phage tail protein [Nitrosospira sp.]
MNHADILGGLLAYQNTDSKCYGIVVGIVTNNQDPDNMHRVKVRFPWLSPDEDSNWARVATPMAGNGRGIYFLPEVDDEVLVAFEHGSIEHPYVVGSLWNGKDQAHENNSDGANNNRGIKSRSGHVIRLCDRSGSESIEIIDKTGNNKITIETSGNKILIEAAGDISITSQSGKITLSAVGIELKSRANVDITANSQIKIEANAQTNIKGALVNIN